MIFFPLKFEAPMLQKHNKKKFKKKKKKPMKMLNLSKKKNHHCGKGGVALEKFSKLKELGYFII